MAFQNAAKPRVYIDYVQYLKAIGMVRKEYIFGLKEDDSTTMIDSAYCGFDLDNSRFSKAISDFQYFKYIDRVIQIDNPHLDAGESSYDNSMFNFSKDMLRNTKSGFPGDYFNYSGDAQDRKLNYLAILGTDQDFLGQINGGTGNDLETPITYQILFNVINVYKNENSDQTHRFERVQNAFTNTQMGIVNWYNSSGPHIDLDLDSESTLEGWHLTELGDYANAAGSGDDFVFSYVYEIVLRTNTNYESDTNYPFPGQLDIINSCSLGKYYDFPVAANSNLRIHREFDGVETLTTKGGSHLKNVRYEGSPKWWNLASAWSITGNQPFRGYGRAGRRKWNLTFDMILDDDVFGGYEGSSLNPFTDGFNLDMTVPTGDNNVYDDSLDHRRIPMLDESNLYSSFLLPTLGGKLPFIFQADSNNASPDQFCTAVIEKKSFRFKRKKIPNRYSIAFTVVECW